MRPRRVIFLIYEGFELLDLSGPSSVFSNANTACGRAEYEVVVVAPEAGEVRSAAGPTVLARALSSVRPMGRDTVLAVGGDRPALERALPNEAIGAWLRRGAKTAGRFGSVCTGTFLLAQAGLLDGRRAATHWAACRKLTKHFDQVSVEPDALYVVDGPVWTSAGASTGIDMALAMVRTDLGAKVMRQVAQQLVVYAHRPGNQSQFSALLDAQSAAGDPFSDVVAWVDAHLEQPIRVGDMARQAGMSERTFYRRFTDVMGISPSKFLERTRLDRARQLLESGAPVKSVAGAVGYRSDQGFRAAFIGRFDVSPSMHRRMHAP